MTVESETNVLQVGDVIEVAARIRGREKHLPLGCHGVVLVDGAGAAWGLVSVRVGGRLWQLHPRSLRLVERAPEQDLQTVEDESAASEVAPASGAAGPAGLRGSAGVGASR